MSDFHIKCPFCNSNFQEQTDEDDETTNECISLYGCKKHDVWFSYDLIAFQYLNYRICYLINTNHFEIRKREHENGTYNVSVYSTTYSPNEPFPLTPHNVEKRLPFYLVYS